uniref:Uncharacterized protein n=2 Tax=Akashiwo sanguinea TaxID=143672 RepID=A0A7S2QWQ2_9DINO|mmetsp:Transcript_278/g.199  ORF Transcript_278/g.199 Transcript_278/m.199 type:complete len:114 (-) Transcript_278:45-386(-)
MSSKRPPSHGTCYLASEAVDQYGNPHQSHLYSVSWTFFINHSFAFSTSFSFSMSAFGTAFSTGIGTGSKHFSACTASSANIRVTFSGSAAMALTARMTTQGVCSPKQSRQNAS